MNEFLKSEVSRSEEISFTFTPLMEILSAVMNSQTVEHVELVRLNYPSEYPMWQKSTRLMVLLSLRVLMPEHL